MGNDDATRSFLVAEVGSLEPFDFVAVFPSGRPYRMLEVTRREDGNLEVRVPVRPAPLPELEASARNALEERGFASEDAADPMLPWTHPAADPQDAVDTLMSVLAEVYAEKPDTSLDVAHGSHRAEHEARQNLALARTRVEKIVAEITDRSPEQDNDKDYVLSIGEVHVMIAPRAAANGQIVIRVFAITNVGFAVTPELGLFLARLNFGLLFGRFALDAENHSIWFDESILGAQFREEELRFAIRMVASTADEWDDRLKQMFGGSTYQEVLASRTPELSSPPTKPGGVGQYL
jgi:hypothetical protein